MIAPQADDDQEDQQQDKLQMQQDWNTHKQDGSNRAGARGSCRTARVCQTDLLNNCGTEGGDWLAACNALPRDRCWEWRSYTPSPGAIPKKECDSRKHSHKGDGVGWLDTMGRTWFQKKSGGWVPVRLSVLAYSHDVVDGLVF